MASVLIVEGSIGEILESITVAKLVGGEPVVLAYGSAAKSGDLGSIGARVYKLDAIHPDPIFNAVKKLYEEIKPIVVVGHGSKNNRDVLSRLAGLYDLPMGTDITKVVEASDSYVVYERGFLSERAVAQEKVPLPAVLLVNAKVFEPASPAGASEVVELPVEEGQVKLVGRLEKQLSGINLEEAEIIVGVGRGFKKKEDLKLAFELAELLGAQVGATRPIAADYKWLPEDAWIGISGKRVAPKLYIAVGISGAPQHMAGVNNAKIIVAVNKDKSAPIFKFADYGVVADLYQFLPVLIKKLKERKGQ
ncbi:MAG: electron transfer flavoprotein subunit alpha/FixB family protein [Desulfurococcales archaeon]|nr:electron transfer flavoprotein subunit alpha/FixB family protein [Desulfurococcales archaeon]